MITVNVSGSYTKTEKFLNNASKKKFFSLLDSYGKLGVNALSSSTPIDTGETANSWSYSISKTTTGYSISWMNSNIQNGVSIAILLQYGHGTRGGGYVQGQDYINPALVSVFNNFANNLWEEVLKI